MEPVILHRNGTTTDQDHGKPTQVVNQLALNP